MGNFTVKLKVANPVSSKEDSIAIFVLRYRCQKPEVSFSRLPLEEVSSVSVVLLGNLLLILSMLLKRFPVKNLNSSLTLPRLSCIFAYVQCRCSIAVCKDFYAV